VTSKVLLSSKLTLLLLVVTAVFFGRLKFKQYKQNKEIESEKQKIIAQISALENKNQEISQSLEYFKSEGFKERVAREQLNLKKPEEQIFSFKSRDLQNVVAEKAPEETIPNFQKWLRYFTNR
jgi:cell division protein FtsB